MSKHTSNPRSGTEDMSDDATARLLFGNGGGEIFNGMVDTENHANDVPDPGSPGDTMAEES